MVKIKPYKVSHSIEITSVCNLSCRHCSMIADKVNMSIETFKKMNIPKDDLIVLTGGEPTLNMELIDYITSEYEHVAIITNMSNLDMDYNIFEQVFLSLNDFTNINNIRKIIKKIDTNKVFVGINVVVNDYTIDNIAKYFDELMTIFYLYKIKLNFIPDFSGDISQDTLNRLEPFLYIYYRNYLEDNMNYGNTKSSKIIIQSNFYDNYYFYRENINRKQIKYSPYGIAQFEVYYYKNGFNIISDLNKSFKEQLYTAKNIFEDKCLHCEVPSVFCSNMIRFKNNNIPINNQTCDAHRLKRSILMSTKRELTVERL